MKQLMRFKILVMALLTALMSTILLTSSGSPVTASQSESNGQTTLASDSTTTTATTTPLTSQDTIPSQKPVQSNHLELVSQGITYQLIKHWVYSVKNGVIADRLRFGKLALDEDPTLESDLAAAIEIPYADDFSFMLVGPGGSEKVENISLNIFDENLAIIHRHVDKTSHTIGSWTLLCCSPRFLG